MYLPNLIILIVGVPIVLVFVPYLLADWQGFQSKLFFIITFALLTVFSLVCVMSYSHSKLGEVELIYQIGFLWMGFILFLTLLVIFYFLIGKFLPISTKHASFLIVFLTIGICSYAYYNAIGYKNYEITFELEGVEKPVTFYHVPDVHLGVFAGKERAQEIVENINNIRPDFVIFNGDFFDSATALTPEVLAPFRQSEVPLYFTTGNHDNYVGIERVHNLLKENNINILENDIFEINNVQFVGLDYLNPDEFFKDPHSSKKTETIKSVMPKLELDKQKALVVFHHSPVGASYIAKAGADLFLAGHTHAGQLFPATLVAKERFEYLKGVYQYDDMKIYVSQGLGTFGPPMRLGTEAEATIVKLLPKK